MRLLNITIVFGVGAATATGISLLKVNKFLIGVFMPIAILEFLYLFIIENNRPPD